MMDASKDPVTVDIKIQQPIVTRYAFYTSCFISESDLAEEYVEVFNLNDVLASGYTIDSKAYLFCNKLFSQENRPESAILIAKKTTESYAEAYSRNRSKDYYFLVLESKNILEILEVSNLINTLNDYKLIFFSSFSDVSLQVSGINNLVWWYTSDELSYPEASVLGRCSNSFPSQTQWSLKTLNNIDVAVYNPNGSTNGWGFDSTFFLVWDTGSYVKLENIYEENISKIYEVLPLANYYARVLDTTVTWGSGTTTDGEWIDIKVFTDWMKWAIQQRVWKLLRTSLKVPATEQGAEQIKLCIKEVLEFSIKQQGIDKYEIKQHILNRSSRSLSIKFNFSYTNSINAVNGVTGYLTF